MNWKILQTLLSPLLLTTMPVFAVVAVLTARLTRPDIFFSITVDPSLRQSERGRAILGLFNRTVIIFSVVGMALTLPGAFAGFGLAIGVALMVAGAVVEFGGMIIAYTNARNQVRPYQVEPSREREVVIKPRSGQPVGGGLGQAGPFLLLGLAAFCLWWRWDSIPQRFPIHWDLYGKPDGWAGKNWRSVFGSLFLGALMCLFFSLLLNGMARGVRRIHSSGPDGEKESRFLRTMLLSVLALEYCLAAMFGFMALLPRLMIILIVGTLLISFAIVVVAVRCGQGGWRMRGQASATVPADRAPAGDRTPDECWKWGLFYYNPEDPAVWVEKRFGIGWTVNFGNARAWFVMGGILLFAVAVPVLSILLLK